MPVIDSQWIKRTHDIFRSAIAHEMGQPAGSAITVSFFNIYHASFSNIAVKKPWWLCKKRDFGWVLVGFQSVSNKIAWKKPGLVRDTAGLCMTIMWTADGPEPDHIRECLLVAESIIDDIELLKGRALPLALNPLQLPHSFEVGVIRSAEIGKKLEEKFRVGEDGPFGPEIDEHDIVKIGALQGLFGEEILPNTETDRAIKISALWQRKAIESSG